MMRAVLAAGLAVGARGDACLWESSEAVSGLNKQCMGLGAAPVGHGSEAECEAYCCAHRFPLAKIVPEDGTGNGYCDLWQWVSTEDLPDASYKWNCFIGTRPGDRGGAEYSCGTNQPSMAHIVWTGGRECLGPTPLWWGDRLIAVFAMMAGIYIGVGTVWGARVSGVSGRAAVRAHPHWRQWEEVAALVEDGVAFARGRRRAGGGVGGEQRERLYVEAPGGDVSPRGSKQGKKEKKAKRAKGDGGNEAKKERSSSASPRPAAAEAAPAAPAAPATSVASGGGGRWVHIPT